MGQVRMLDKRLNEDGYLRLMTAEPLVQNMSNTLPEHLKTQIRKPSEQKNVRKSNFAQFAPIRKLLLWQFMMQFFGCITSNQQYP